MKHKILHWITFVFIIFFEFLMLTFYKHDKSNSAHSDFYNILPTFNEILHIFIVLDIIMFILCVSITVKYFKSKNKN